MIFSYVEMYRNEVNSHCSILDYEPRCASLSSHSLALYDVVVVMMMMMMMMMML